MQKQNILYNREWDQKKPLQWILYIKKKFGSWTVAHLV